MDKLYSKKYFSELEKADKIEYPRNARILEEILPYFKKGKLLDIGVGSGLFMELAQNKGFEVYGLDVSEYAIEQVAKRLKIKKGKQLVISELTKKTFPENFFEAINLRHSIEHVKDPLELMQNVYHILKPGGVVTIATPNSYGIHAKIFGSLWPHWSVPYHIQFFSKKSLREVVEKSGFVVKTLKTEELTNYDLFRGILKRIGVPINYNRATWLTVWLNNILAKIGLGEGLLVVAQKEK